MPGSSGQGQAGRQGRRYGCSWVLLSSEDSEVQQLACGAARGCIEQLVVESWAAHSGAGAGECLRYLGAALGSTALPWHSGHVIGESWPSPWTCRGTLQRVAVAGMCCGLPRTALPRPRWGAHAGRERNLCSACHRPADRSAHSLAMESNKENQEGPAASVSVASPRVSSVGAPSEGGDHPAQQSQPQGYQPTPYSDHLHWGGVQRMLHARSDARSVASSAAADRDDKSIYAEDVGALDAHTGEQGPRLSGAALACWPSPRCASPWPQRAMSTTRMTTRMSPRSSL